MMAMLPGVKLSKSLSWQPDVDVFAGWPVASMMSTPCGVAVTSPEPEYSIVAKPLGKPKYT